MPPAIFIGAVGGTGNLTTNQRFVPPTATRPGDVQIVVVASEFDDLSLAPTNPPQLDIDNWEELSVIHLGASGSVLIARRIARASDPASFRAFIQGGGPLIGSAMLVYRDLNPSASVVGASGTAVPLGTNFVCPSRTLAAYSDLYLGIVGIASNAVAVTNPGGTTERFDASTQVGKQLEIFELLPEAAGATGTKTATTAGNQIGYGVSVALAANGVRGGNKILSGVAPVPGMIGLPIRGI